MIYPSIITDIIINSFKGPSSGSRAQGPKGQDDNDYDSLPGDSGRLRSSDSDSSETPHRPKREIKMTDRAR